MIEPQLRAKTEFEIATHRTVDTFEVNFPDVFRKSTECIPQHSRAGVTVTEVRFLRVAEYPSGQIRAAGMLNRAQR